MAVNFTVTDARNPVWANDDKNAITLEVNFAEITDSDYVSFTASPSDVVEHSRTIYANAVNGDYGTVSDYTHHRLWHPIDQSTVDISNVGLVQILLEKGLLDDYDVDAILVENTETVAFARTTTNSSMNGDWDGI
tara:strand:+ start:1588 stop:1992 length:405 start_codon:yes stop_codon:yes gene_type:complete